MDIDTDICIQNAIDRSKKEKTSDIAAGFDNSKLQDEFIEFINKFKTNSLPKILDLFETYKNDKKIYILKNYSDVDNFINNLESKIL